MTGGQKVVASVALGAALAAIASFVVAQLNAPTDGGWFMYSPTSTASYTSSGSGDAVRATAVWLAAVGVWFGVSFRLFRAPKERG